MISHNRFDLTTVQTFSLDKRLQTAICKCTCRLGYFWNVLILCQNVMQLVKIHWFSWIHWFRCVGKLFYSLQSSYWSLGRNDIFIMYCIMNWKTKSKSPLGSFFNDILISPEWDIWVIEQVWGQDGWTLAKFFLWMFKLAKKNEVNIQPSWPNRLGQ